MDMSNTHVLNFVKLPCRGVSETVSLVLFKINEKKNAPDPIMKTPSERAYQSRYDVGDD